MSKFILNRKYALRSYRDCPRAVAIKDSSHLNQPNKEMFEILLHCDGTYDFKDIEMDSDDFRFLLAHETIKEALNGEKLDDWQKFKVCDNNRKSIIDLRITGRCNLNCPHCFNAVDNNYDLDEWSVEEIDKLIKEATDCGVSGFIFTGGEPFCHPHFMEIVDKVYKNNMFVDSIKTNGFFLTQEVLDKLKEYSYQPRLYISFDGIGHHDKMRGMTGLEQKTLDIIRLCVDNGFEVIINSQVNAITKDSLVKTAEVFDEIGVKAYRMIRTTETPRSNENMKDDCLTPKEYFDFFIEFWKEFSRKPHSLQVICWQFGMFKTKNKKYHMDACLGDTNGEDVKCCLSMLREMAIGSDGKVYVCHQSSGYYDIYDIDLGNVKKNGLRNSINNPRYIEESSVSSFTVRDHDEKCGNCKHFRLCHGGCRMMGRLFNSDIRSFNPFMCLYYEGGYEEKLKQVLPDWKNVCRSTD